MDQPSFNGPFRFNDEAYRVTRWHQSFLELPCGKGWDARSSTGRLAERKHLVAVEPLIANLGIDMPKARLHLIVCSDDTGPEARDRLRERSLQLSVIDGGRRAIVAERGNQGENPWGALLGLFDLAVLVSQTNYLTFVAASLTALELHGWTDRTQTN